MKTQPIFTLLISILLSTVSISCTSEDSDLTNKTKFDTEEAIYQQQFDIYSQENKEYINNIKISTKSPASNCTTLIDAILGLDNEMTQNLKDRINVTLEEYEKYQCLQWEAINKLIDTIGADNFAEYYYYFADGLYKRNRVELYNSIQNKDDFLKKLYIYTAAKFDVVIPIFITSQTRMSKSECCLRRLLEAMGKGAIADIIVDLFAGALELTTADFILAGFELYDALELAEAYNACMWNNPICDPI